MVNLVNDSAFFGIVTRNLFFVYKNNKNVNFKFMIMTNYNKNRTGLNLHVLLEKIQSHPQMSTQKLCFGFSSPHILWKHRPNSWLLWQCFPGRCRQNFLKMFAFNIWPCKSQECFTSSVSFLRDCRMTRNVQIYMCVYYACDKWSCS